VLWREGDDWPVEGAEAVGYMGIKRPPLDISEKVILFDSLEHYARGLFMAMRYLEKKGVKVIVADYPAKEGLGLAIRDRLYRASSAEFDENPHDVVK
jgi:L-threonylcarbamoyladenylate synthase